MKPSPRLSLNNGVLIDQLGFGLYKVPPADAAGLVTMALEAGYRHFDTAAMYGNETGVGRGIGSLSGFSSDDDARGGSGESSPALSREDLFVTTKLWNDDQGYDATLRAFDTSMANLGLEYVDLYLIHWPCAQRGLYPESYRAMETLYREGKARAIGVSNFQPAHLDRLLQTAEVVPAVNQIELHPWLQQEELRTLHRELGITTEAWSPLGRGQVLQDPVVLELAAAHGKTAGADHPPLACPARQCRHPEGQLPRPDPRKPGRLRLQPRRRRHGSPGRSGTWLPHRLPPGHRQLGHIEWNTWTPSPPPALPCSAPRSRPAPMPPRWSWTAPRSPTGATSRSG